MANRAFIGTIEPVGTIGGESKVLVGPVFVLDPDGTIMRTIYDQGVFYTYINADYNFTYASVKAASEQQIRDEWNDQTLEMFWVNDVGTSLDPTISSPSRSLNTAFRSSLTRLSWVSYTVELAVTAGLFAGAVATCELRSDAGSSPTTVIASARDSCGALVGLSSTLRFQLSGWVKKGDYVKLVTTVTGNASATLISSHETVF